MKITICGFNYISIDLISGQTSFYIPFGICIYFNGRSKDILFLKICKYISLGFLSFVEHCNPFSLFKAYFDIYFFF